MSIINYPPQIATKLPAFIYKAGEQYITINVPYTLNSVISTNDFDKMALVIKTAVTNSTVWGPGTTNTCKIFNRDMHSYYASFVIPAEDFTPIPGNYYKIQLAFQKDGINSMWSTVGIMKCINAPTLIIDTLQTQFDNALPKNYIGIYENTDVTEKIYSYRYIIYDNENKIYEDSQEIIYNGSEDKIINNTTLQSKLPWKSKVVLKPYIRYRVKLSITTINGYTKTTPSYVVRDINTVNSNIPARLVATLDPDNACVHLSLIKLSSLDKEQAFSGSYIISRYSESSKEWHEIYSFHAIAQKPSDLGTVWTDYTIEHGEKYLYSLQATYNNKTLYSNHMYHVVLNNNGSYVENEAPENPTYVISDFEDMFLTDADRQLKIRFNPGVSSFKPVILESKIETMGGKYPFILRNGNINYKEFSISGLLSYLIDEKELFMTGIQPKENTIKRGTASNFIPSFAGSALTTENFYKERQFKTEALAWLTNGRPKLFRSPGEGSFIIQLMNVSLSPNETLGRMLHTFSATAYEVAEYNYDNLMKYSLIVQADEVETVIKVAKIKFSEYTNNEYSPAHTMYNIKIIDAAPYSKYEIHFEKLQEDAVVEYEIGASGALTLDIDSYPVISIKHKSGEIYDKTSLEYIYYDKKLPSNYDDVTVIKLRDEVSQIIGPAENVIPMLEDAKRKVDYIYNLTIKPKRVYSVYWNGNDYCYLNSEQPVDIWLSTLIYEVHESKNGKSTGKFIYGDDIERKLSNVQPNFNFNLNNSTDGVVDLSYHNEWEAKNGNFNSMSEGCYHLSSNIGPLQSLALGSGVYAELSYNLKEINYAFEKIDNDVKTRKALMDSAYAAYMQAEETVLTEENKMDVLAKRASKKETYKTKYKEYVNKIQEILDAGTYRQEDEYYDEL